VLGDGLDALEKKRKNIISLLGIGFPFSALASL
jgi:hypothetical protein